MGQERPVPGRGAALTLKDLNQKMVDMIAIDGPAASGKTTLAKLMAENLGLLFFDTGVMYRAVTLAALNQGIAIKDEKACTILAEEIQIDVRPSSQNDGRSNDVLIDGIDQTWAIRTPEVESNVSEVSAYRGVRKALSEQQRRIGLQGQVVMVGRDIGTIVLPEAGLKIFLVASVEERAKRRHKECLERGKTTTYEQILEDMQNRDEIDSTREIAPLCPADDAVVIDSDGKDIDQVLEIAMALVKGKHNQG